MNDSWSRRRLLCSLGSVGAVTALSGCSLLSGESGISVAGIAIVSHHDSETAVHANVERNGEQVFDETVTLAADEHVVREGTWSTEPATYRVLTGAFGPEAEHEVYETTIDRSYHSGEVECFVLELRFGAPGSSYNLTTVPARNWDVGCD